MASVMITLGNETYWYITKCLEESAVKNLFEVAAFHLTLAKGLLKANRVTQIKDRINFSLCS